MYSLQWWGVFQFCIACIRHGTHVSSCIIYSWGTHVCYHNWKIGISSVTDSNLHNSYRGLMERWFHLSHLQMGLKSFIITFIICGDILKEATDFYLSQGCFIVICRNVNTFIIILDIDIIQDCVRFLYGCLGSSGNTLHRTSSTLGNKMNCFHTSWISLAANDIGVVASLLVKHQFVLDGLAANYVLPVY